MNKASLILAGGAGTRMKTSEPKVLCRVAEKPMLGWVISAVRKADIENICVVTGFGSEKVCEYLNGTVKTVLQKEQKGTGHAVMCAQEFLDSISGNLLVLYGDAPFIDEDTINSALKTHTEQQNSVTVISAVIDDPSGYGRIIRTPDGGLAGIVEQKDANSAQLAVKEINSGAYWFEVSALKNALKKLSNNNSQGEYYLTDAVSIILSDGGRAGAHISLNSSVVLGANDRAALFELSQTAKQMIIKKHLENGVEFVSADGVVISPDVTIGEGTRILPGTILTGTASIGKNCVIGPNSLIDSCTVGDGTVLNAVQAYDSKIHENVKIGPFSHIRPGSEIMPGVKMGDFVEIKNSVIGKNTAVAHLTYVGDSDVGERVNFGCGTVTVNYDGKNKYRTVIGDDAFIGCNTNLVAPVKVGDRAYTAAGSTVTEDVPEGALCIARSRQTNKPGYADKKYKRKK